MRGFGRWRCPGGLSFPTRRQGRGRLRGTLRTRLRAWPVHGEPGDSAPRNARSLRTSPPGKSEPHVARHLDLCNTLRVPTHIKARGRAPDGDVASPLAASRVAGFPRPRPVQGPARPPESAMLRAAPRPQHREAALAAGDSAHVAAAAARCGALLTPAGAFLPAAPGRRGRGAGTGSPPWRMQRWKNLATRLGGVGSNALAQKPLAGSSSDETEKDGNQPQTGIRAERHGLAARPQPRWLGRLPAASQGAGKPLEPKAGKP